MDRLKRWIFESSVAAATCDLSETPGNYEIEERSDRRADDVALWKGKRNAGEGRFEEVAEVEKEDGGVGRSGGGLKGGNWGSGWKKVEICGRGRGSDHTTVQILCVTVRGAKRTVDR